jgi:hypothetical protein
MMSEKIEKLNKAKYCNLINWLFILRYIFFTNQPVNTLWSYIIFWYLEFIENGHQYAQFFRFAQCQKLGSTRILCKIMLFNPLDFKFNAFSADTITMVKQRSETKIGVDIYIFTILKIVLIWECIFRNEF